MKFAPRTVFLLILLSLPLAGLQAAGSLCVAGGDVDASATIDHSGHGMSVADQSDTVVIDDCPCCDECASLCASAGLQILALRSGTPAVVSWLVERHVQTVDIPIPGPAPPLLYRPPITSC